MLMKSPVIVDPKTCNIQNAAKRIVWGKTHNSGQVCIAPDYAIVPRAQQDVFVDALQKAIQEFFPDGPFAPRAMGKMVNTAAFKRVRTLIEESQGEIVSGGEYDESTKGIAPTIVKNCTWDDALMSQELFGPVLPIIPVDSIDEGLAHIRSNDSPLALYAFTSDAKLQDKIRRETQSGSIIFNDVVIQAAAEGLPFGGVGPSGSGGYHNGKFGFDVFTHNRASMNNHPIMDLFMSFRYPPFVARTFVMKMMAPPMPTRPKGPPTSTVSARQEWSKWIVLLVALVFAGGLTSHRLKGPSA